MGDVGTSSARVLYEQANVIQRVRRGRVGCVLAIAFVLLGGVLDDLLYVGAGAELVAPRLLCVAFMMPVLVLLFTPWAGRLARVLGIAWATAPAAAMAWLAYVTDSVYSPYVAFTCLLMLAVALLMPWTVAEVLLVCGAAVAFHGLSCLGTLSMPGGLGGADAITESGKRSLVYNMFVLFLTMLVSGAAARFLSRLRFNEFMLRQELADRNVRLDESYTRLAGLDRLKTQFFANVSHELRTPLTLVISPLDSLIQRGGTGTGATDDMIRVARDNGLRLLRLVNQMLDLAKFDEKAAQIHPRNEDLGHLVAGVVSSAAHLAKAKKLRLDVQTPPGEQLVASVDAAAFEKVLLNLFTNAVKFTPEGGQVEVSLERQGANALVRVSDTGIGIAPENLPRIFDRFAQMDQSSTRKYSGIGIGLALARQLVHAHGGTLTAASEPGRGTRMTVQLPLAIGQAPAPTPPAPEIDAISDIHTRARRAVTLPDAREPQAIVGVGDELVLVVEDEPDMCQFVVDLLCESYRVARAGNGADGLVAAQQLRPALVVLDVMLPQMDGLEVCRRLRAEPGLESTRVVLLTARSDEEAKLTALQNGAHDFLTKPFSSLELQTRVANLLQAAKLEEKLRATNTELSQTLQTLRETEAQLIQSEKINALGTMAAGLLHEILNPLNYTLTAIQLAIEETTPAQAEMRETLADAEGGMKRIRDIVGDLKTFAHPQAHRQVRTFRFRDAVKAARRIAGPVLSDCKFVEDVPESAMITGSEGQLVQLLVNLFTNAARATRARADREVRVSASQSNGTISFKVRDNGMGISKDNLGKVFDPFFTTQEPGQGMGLGLTICQTIVRNHGGKIQIESNQGDWTEVAVELPSKAHTG